MKQSIETTINAILSGYWPRGLFFRSRAHKQFLLQFKDYIDPGGICLDLGCGPRAAYKPYIEMHDLEWFGADVIESIDLPVQTYRRVTNSRIPFDTDFFDVICLFNVIEHFTNPESMLTEIRRTLKPDGILCGACAFWEMEHDSYFHVSHKGLKELLGRHGFEILSPSSLLFFSEK